MNKSGCLGIIIIVISIVGCLNPTIFIWIGLTIIVYLVIKHTCRMRRIDRLKNYIANEDYRSFRNLLQDSYKSLTKRQIKNVQLDYVRTIEERGIHSIFCNEVIGKNKICFYHYPVQIVRMRQTGGGKYIDFHNAEPATLYLFRMTLELVSSGHRVIKLTDIVNMEAGSKENMQVLSIVVRNIGSPVLIVCPDPIVVKHLIKILQ